MKKIFKIKALVLLCLGSGALSAQVLTNSQTVDQFNNNNAFFDGSTNFDPTFTFDNNNGKGLVFPRTDLTQWVWLLDDMNNGGGTILQTAYDGMIVYNTGTGNTPTGGNNPSTSTAVTPGFYYFSNPTVDPNNFAPSITAGQWVRIGSGGASITSGSVNPTNGTGNTGDFYINTTTNEIFGPYANGLWGNGTSLIGPQGAQGADGAVGPQGAQGTSGADGKSVLNGTVNPVVGIGNIGDFYINTSTNQLFGPKSAGGWGTGVSIVGPQGPAGSDANVTGSAPISVSGGVVSLNNLGVSNQKLADNAVTSTKIQDGQVLNQDIANLAVNSAKLADNAVTSAKIQDGQVANADLANNAVNSAKIQDGQVANADLADNAVTSAKIQDGQVANADLANNAVNSAKIQDGQVANADLANNAVNSTKIQDGQVLSQDLANGAVTSTKLTSNIAIPGTSNVTIPAGTTAQRPAPASNGMLRYNTSTNKFEMYQNGAWVNIDQGTIYTGSTSVPLVGNSFQRAALAGDVLSVQNSNSTTIANNAVNNAKLADNAVSSNKIQDGQVANADLANNAVNSAKIQDGQVANLDLADNAVTSTKIQDGQVLNQDIANLAVNSAKLADNAVTSAKIQDGQVANADLASNAVNSAKIQDGQVLNADLADNAVTSAKIQDGQVLNQDLANGAVTAAKLNQMGASSGQVMQWNGTAWVPVNVPTGTIKAGLSSNFNCGRIYSGTMFSVLFAAPGTAGTPGPNEYNYLWFNDIFIPFNFTFASAPNVSATLQGAHPSIQKVQIVSVVNNGFTVRVYNYDSSTNVRVQWIASLP